MVLWVKVATWFCKFAMSTFQTILIVSLSVGLLVCGISNPKSLAVGTAVITILWGAALIAMSMAVSIITLLVNYCDLFCLDSKIF
jgi:hypothetical protein